MNTIWLRSARDKTDYICPNCNTPWQFLGPRNPFHWQCPTCQSWLTWVETEQFEPVPVKVCQKCGGDMERREGQRGAFYGCENYPACKSTRYKDDWRLERVREIALSR